MDNQGTTTNNNEITKEEVLKLCLRLLEMKKKKKETKKKKTKKRKEHVTIFVAYDGKWEREGIEWLFMESKGSIMVVSKYVTLSQITDILCTKFDVDRDSRRLKLVAYYRIGFPIIEIECDEDLSLFISESSKTKLLLCVTAVLKDDVAEGVGQDEINPDIKEESPNGHKEDEINPDIEEEFRPPSGNFSPDIRKESRLPSGNFSPDIRKESRLPSGNFSPDIDEESSLCRDPPGGLTFRRLFSQPAHNRLDFIDDRVEIRLYKAIQKNDWVKAREIVNTKEVTWTSKLDDDGQTAFHFAVGRYKNNEVVRDLMAKNSELLVTTVNIKGENPAHTAAYIGNHEALKIMLDSNPKCLFIHDNYGFLPIHYALSIPSLKTFLYLFKQMKSYTVEFDLLIRGTCALKLLRQVIDTGLIDVAYELICKDPSMATAVDDDDETPLEWIVERPELFYSGSHYNLWQRFVYHFVPIENKSFSSTDTADVENQEIPKKDKSDTKHTRRCLHDVISRICVKLWETTLLHVSHVKQLKDDKVKHNTNIKLLRRICEEADKTYTESDIELLYSSPFCLAVENNSPEAVDVLATYFAGLYNSKKDGRNIYQLIVLNRSEKVYNYVLHHDRFAKSGFSLSLDDDNNNILHLAGRLAPRHKLIAAFGPALQMQQELRWFEELKRVVGITKTQELNKNKETPMMVFREKHMELRKDGEEWIKRAADSYTVTAALIIALVFAAAITVPGGNDSATGKPINETKASLIIFAISVAISLFTATTSLLLFLSVITSRYADEDFLFKLPNAVLTFGLLMLIVSVTYMIIAFIAALYIMFGQGKAWILIPIAALACLPIASFVTVQFPLLVELISLTYGHGYFGKEKDWQSSANAKKKKRT